MGGKWIFFENKVKPIWNLYSLHPILWVNFLPAFPFWLPKLPAIWNFIYVRKNVHFILSMTWKGQVLRFRKCFQCGWKPNRIGEVLSMGLCRACAGGCKISNKLTLMRAAKPAMLDRPLRINSKRFLQSAPLCVAGAIDRLFGCHCLQSHVARSCLYAPFSALIHSAQW